MRILHRRNRVGDSRTGGYSRNAGYARDSGDRVGCKDSGRLVAHIHDTDAEILGALENRGNVSAAQREQELHAMGPQHARNLVAAIHVAFSLASPALPRNSIML